jgi:KEOPS complex subunit Pcc1
MKGCLDLEFPSNYAEYVFQALRPEQEDDLMRSKVTLSQDQGLIKLKIEGDDIVSIRSALNTWIRLVKIAFELTSI